MTVRQITMLEDEINNIQRKISQAQTFMEGANFLNRPEEAKRWSRVIDDEQQIMIGIRMTLSVLGYSIGWKNGKHNIISAGA